MVDLSANPDNLLPFLDLAASNQRANVARFPEPYQLIRRVNICLATAGKNLHCCPVDGGYDFSITLQDKVF
jgi:hypothetical protein